MKNIKLEFKNIEIYMYIASFLVILFTAIFFYDYIKDNVYNSINNNETVLDPSSIRIRDVDIEKFKKVSEEINQKNSTQKPEFKNVFP